MKTPTKIAIAVVILALYVTSLIGLASAVTISEINNIKIYPGEDASISIEVSNTLDEDIEDVSLILNLDNTGFISVGSNEDNEVEIRDGDEESFNFRIKAPSTLAPGAYNIPYTLLYNVQDEVMEKKGSFGVEVSAKTELSYSVESEMNVIGEQGRIALKIINSGLGDIRFVNVKLGTASGYDLLSPSQVYVGTVNSDDFENANFEVLFKNKNTVLNAVVTYKDFENVEQTENITLPVTVYTQEEALELGLIKKSNVGLYFSLVVLLIVLWIVWRILRKRKKEKVRQAMINSRKNGR